MAQLPVPLPPSLVQTLPLLLALSAAPGWPAQATEIPVILEAEGGLLVLIGVGVLAV